MTRSPVGETAEFHLKKVDENNGYTKFCFFPGKLANEIQCQMSNLVQEACGQLSGKSVKWHKHQRANLEKCIKSLEECIHIGPTIPLLGIPKEAIMDINKYTSPAAVHGVAKSRI